MFRKRTIYDCLVNQLHNGKITILIGARQVGKTMLLRELHRNFKDRYTSLFFDLDIYSQYEQVSTYENFLNTLILSGYNPENTELFIVYLDEFQRYADLSIVLKTIHDHHPTVKIYASGSSSLIINERIQESLAGRKRVIRVYPLSFLEYLHFCNRDDSVDKLKKLSNVQSDKLSSLLAEEYGYLEDFLIYGGYPEVALVPQKEKGDVLTSIFDLYVKKDLVDFLSVERISHAKAIINSCAVNHGQETKYSRLAQRAAIDEKTAKNYLEILKETFILSIHPPWFTNRNLELVKMPKVYFIDSGVRNFFIQNFNPPEFRTDVPVLFEGYVISELLKYDLPAENIKFWRTKNRQEVDLIIKTGGTVTIAEIKYKKTLKKSDYNGLAGFRHKYPEYKNYFMINLNSNKQGHDGVQNISPFELERLLNPAGNTSG